MIPDKFLLYDVPYDNVTDTYKFVGVQEYKHLRLYLYTGIKHEYTLEYETLEEILRNVN